jgi:hypothetical protein
MSYKLDGTNASVWLGQDGELQAGSRNRHLAVGEDNAGFLHWLQGQGDIKAFLKNHPQYILYGEWLVPHTLKNYQDAAWRMFYVFDVYDTQYESYIPYEEYAPRLNHHNIQLIEPMWVGSHPTYEQLQQLAAANTFLVKEGIGEGIVIKNYDFVNQFGNVVWAKLVTSEFKEEKVEKWGACKEKPLVEEAICNKFVTPTLVDKTYAKILTEGEWSGKSIPQLLNRVYHDLITEEMWDIIKTMKNPVIDFRTLQTICIQTIKKLKPELF